ncbi:MAG: DNA gyrase subunit A [Peptostreptococcales bacterium]
MSDNLMDNSKILQVDINDEMQNSYIDYAMSVIIGRALPDVRDGLKPVHRRILYAMSELGLQPDKPYRKSARIVGDVLGKYHPHGDSSVYGAMVRMAQDFSIRYLLVDGHGNFGSVDGDGAAAMRYTEAKMTSLTSELLRDINKETVDFTPNFDETLQEPAVLPSRFPNLIVNGSNGIAVGMATSIPPHNLGEVIDAIVKVIDDDEATIDDVIKIIKGPDFPTGATILGINNIKEAYRTGLGKVTVRSKVEIEDTGKREQIIIKEIPYQVNKASLIEKIAELVRDKRVEGIFDLRDESDRNGMRVVIELKRDGNPYIILNRLYKHTQLQDTYSIIMIALVNGQPETLNMLQLIQHYINHQKDIVTKRTKYDLGKAQERAHILEGLIIALDNIDAIIKLIRASANDQEAKEGLVANFNLSEKQAQAILDMRLRRLTGLEREKILQEYDELLALIKKFLEILGDEKLLMALIKEELLEIKEKYSDPRRTEILAAENEIEEEDLIEEEEVALTMTHLGYVKRVPADTYKLQKRGGKGVTALTTRENDFVIRFTTTSTHNYLLFFTNRGKVYRMKAYEIPEAKRHAKGTPIVNLLELKHGEKITAMIPIKSFDKDKYLMSVTKKGVIKKTELSQFDTSRKSGIIAINLKEDDELISVQETQGESDVIIVTKKGKSICFSEKDVRDMGRTAAGVRAIILDDEDRVISMDVFRMEEDKHNYLLVATRKGYGKKTLLSEYKIQARGGKGIRTYTNDKNVLEKTGELIGAVIVNEDDELMLINSDGILIRIQSNEISNLRRATQGVKLMKVDEDANIISLSKVFSIGDNDNGDDDDKDQFELEI